jgi:hypothetical protein
MFAFYGKLKSFSAIAGMTAVQSHISAWQITLTPIVTPSPSRLRRPGPRETQGNRNAQPSNAQPRPERAMRRPSARLQCPRIDEHEQLLIETATQFGVVQRHPSLLTLRVQHRPLPQGQRIVGED